MAAQPPPLVFSPQRRLAVRKRALHLQQAADAPRYLIADMVEDVIERLAFLRHQSQRALVIGDWTATLAAHLRAGGTTVSEVEPARGFDEERPYPDPGFDLIVSVGTLDTVNDLPGALVHIRQALVPGGMALATMIGAGSLPVLRDLMLEIDGDRPAPRLHPMVDVRGGGQLVQRVGWAEPVVDGRSLDIRFSSLGRLVADLRAQALTNVLERHGPPLNKRKFTLLNQQFEQGTVERFEILTLSGRRP